VTQPLVKWESAPAIARPAFEVRLIGGTVWGIRCGDAAIPYDGVAESRKLIAFPPPELLRQRIFPRLAASPLPSDDLSNHFAMPNMPELRPKFIVCSYPA